jgi:hypothetical protein
MFRARLGFIPLLPVLLVVFIAAPAMGMFAGRACMQGTGDLTTRIARLEDEISFRRRALRDALEKATTIQEIRQAQGVLGVHSPVRYPELRGRTLSDLTRELDGLHAQLEIVLPPEAPSTRPPVDTHLVGVLTGRKCAHMSDRVSTEAMPMLTLPPNEAGVTKSMYDALLLTPGLFS